VADFARHRRQHRLSTSAPLRWSVGSRKGATTAQVALAWLLAQHLRIVPIPGTTKIHGLQENSAAVDVELTPEDPEEITAAADRVDVQGERYPAHMQRWINR
jgi:aryl-alcohol dehydrogenase-like predicted oxidoreductase